MAQMYPATLPKHILGNRQLKGEIEVYEVLTKLPAGFEVFYNRCAQSGPFIEACERQVDFILLHEKYGMLCMEVKGGKVRMLQDGSFEQYHPSKKAWASIKPIEQVKNAWFKLLSTCKSDGVNYWIPEDCCVVLPKTSRHDLTDIHNLFQQEFFAQMTYQFLQPYCPGSLLKSKVGVNGNEVISWTCAAVCLLECRQQR